MSFYNWRWHKFAETCPENRKLLCYFFKLSLSLLLFLRIYANHCTRIDIHWAVGGGGGGKTCWSWILIKHNLWDAMADNTQQYFTRYVAFFRTLQKWVKCTHISICVDFNDLFFSSFQTNHYRYSHFFLVCERDM